MFIDGIDHVQLAMPPGGEEEATAFYEGVLDIPRVPKPPALEARGGCWFERGALRVHVGVQPDFVPATKAHVAFSVIDVDRLISLVTAAGLDHLEADDGAGRQVYVNDPFGNRLEFRAPRPVPPLPFGASRVLAAAREIDETLETSLAFFAELDRLRTVERRTFILGQERRENSAEHSWHVAMLALVCVDLFDDALDLDRVIQMLLIHDIVEVDAGDTFIYDDDGRGTRRDREAAAASRIFGLLPEFPGRTMRALWDEFETGESPEARYARAMDRLAPLLLNVSGTGLVWRRYGIEPSDVRRVCAPIGEASDDLGVLADALLERAEADGLFDS